MDTTKILDKNINFSNYANFRNCRIKNKGKIITFVMACGVQYDVAIDYFLQWNKHPHYLLTKGKLIEGDKSSQHIEEKPPIFSKYWMTLSNTAVMVCLSNDSVYEVPWDTVLMACEERYEHFGGLTDESKRIVFKRWGVLKGAKRKR